MVTMRDIAAKAGVSQATVSYALHADPSISPATRDKVLKVAEELHYTVNISARMLRSGKSNAIALVLQELHNPYSMHISDAISQYALSRGYQTLIQQTMYATENEVSVLRHISSEICDGVIFSPTKLSLAEVRTRLGGKPTVMLNPLEQHAGYDMMNVACEQGAFTATSYLLSRGCKRLLFSCANFREYDDIKNAWDSGWQRVAGFQRALWRNGIEPQPWNFVPNHSWSREASRDAIVDVVRSGLDFDGVVCVNDESAIGVMRGLLDCGVRIPEDVSVTGLDGIEEGEFYTPSLTTIAMDFDDFAKQCVDTLIDRINGADDPPREMTAVSRLVVRESTR
ncbi:LacI family DNA-binding transcriptional regulator [Bifidobacterium sp. SO1]|uniref:LacI family DNA-binding transcriptional regulator n=1 Tax=Bifidobacterium sp. SO1 TaxID=2809029 RepID=UPI001BDC55E0|nr:LacI family DNA-binding transcriptional regulator [Bifidobacterium sp. SO1]MBT1160604.1 LacI family DNA-binding transcriptional regulator [Bifidobacterium sp. SO1]